MNLWLISALLTFSGAFDPKNYDFGAGLVLDCLTDNACTLKPDAFKPDKIVETLKLNRASQLPFAEELAKNLIALKQKRPEDYALLVKDLGKEKFQLILQMFIDRLLYNDSYSVALDVFEEFAIDSDLNMRLFCHRSVPSSFYPHVGRYRPHLVPAMRDQSAYYVVLVPAYFNDRSGKLLESEIARVTRPGLTDYDGFINMLCQPIEGATNSQLNLIRNLLYKFAKSEKVKKEGHVEYVLAVADLCYGLDYKKALKHIRKDADPEVLEAGLLANSKFIAQMVFKEMRTLGIISLDEE